MIFSARHIVAYILSNVTTELLKKITPRSWNDPQVKTLMLSFFSGEISILGKLNHLPAGIRDDYVEIFIIRSATWTELLFFVDWVLPLHGKLSDVIESGS